MGQKEIVDYLALNKEKWHSANEIIEALNNSKGSVLACLFKLRSTTFVKYKIIKRRIIEYRYKYNEESE